MRKIRILMTALAIALLFVMLFTAAAMADVTQVRNIGGNAVEIRWDDTSADAVVFVYKTGNDFEADFERYGYIFWPVDSGKNKMTVYNVAPGQSYWAVTLSLTDGFTNPYSYNVPKAANFTEWQHPPKMQSCQLMEKSMEGRTTRLNQLSVRSLESENSLSTYSVRVKITWPTLKASRTYLWQIVVTSPDGYKYVIYDEFFEMPAGRAWVEPEFQLNDYFETLYQQRGEIPVGVYTFSAYWDGMHACSSTFAVR
ncbi:MAG: hypothetical protein IKP10_08325 [Clostridia bacterium]|nr:hypothetical protein [Clostridia bacterium]